jgi:hypothetical protein
MQRIHVNLRAIGDRKSARASIECKEEVGAAEQHGLGALIAAQALTGRKQLGPRLRDNTIPSRPDLCRQ